MKILLLMPKVFFDTWPVGNNTLGKVTNYPAATLPVLAASLGDRECTIFDGLYASITLENYRKLLCGHQLIGISVVSPLTALDTEITIKLIRRINPAAKIVLGGHHATAYDVEWVEKGADVVVREEGEVTFPEVVDALTSGSSLGGILGITYRDGDLVKQNADRPYLTDLDLTPFPRWSLMDLTKYNLHLRQSGGPTACLETSRGCKQRCTFCSASAMWRYTQRHKSVDRLIAELDYLKSLGVTQVGFGDDNFGSDVQRTGQLFEEILKRDYGFVFWSFFRVDTAHDNPWLVELAARAGLKSVYVGYEHLTPTLNEEYRKGLGDKNSYEKFQKVYELFRKNGIMVYGLFVHNYRFESQAEKLNALKCRTICDISSPKKFTPMKGAPALNDLIAAGLVFKDTFYHEQFSPSYLQDGRPQENISLWVSFRNLFNAKLLGYAINGPENKRTAVRTFYRTLFSYMLNVRPRSVLNFLESLRLQHNPQLRQQKLLDYYLSDPFIDRLARWKYYYWG